MLVAAALTVFAASFLRNRSLAVVVSSGAVVVLLSGGLLAQLFALGTAAWAAGALWGRATGRHVSFPLAAFNVFSIVILLLAVATAAGAVVPSDLTLGARTRVAAGAEAPRQSIYVLLLDGYPREDTLRDEFRSDNSPFAAALSIRGFTYYPDAMTPAARTELTLLSMLGGEVDADTPPTWSPRTVERRQIRAAVQTSPVVDRLRGEGYWLVHLASPILHTNFAGWDETIDTGQVSELEIALLGRSPLAPLFGDWILGQLRDRTTETLDAFAGLAERERPKVVLAHLMSPHPPFLYGGAPECYAEGRCSLFEVRPRALGMTDIEYARALAIQVDAINALVLDALDRVIAADPRAIVVVMGDHGARHDEDRADEWRRSLFAVRGSDAFDSDPSPRDLFQRLLRGTRPAR